MSMYEFTFLVDDAKALKPLEKVLESVDGKKTNEEAWGKRLLAYPINKNSSAEFYTWHIDIKPERLEEFKTKLNYDNIVMRYLILASESAPKKSAKKQEQQES